MAMNITEEKLKELITCQKNIYVPPHRAMQLSACHYKKDFKARAIDNSNDFSVFIRQNSILPENFSVGLNWYSNEYNKYITLFRCNGLHGGNKNIEHHNHQHIHYLDIEAANEGYFMKTTAEITNKYSTLDDALFYFYSKCNIVDMPKYFPNLLSIPLFEKESD